MAAFDSPADCVAPRRISVPQAASIFVSHFPNKVAWIRVAGRGDLHNSPRLLRFAQCMIDKGETRLVVDLEDCPMMDSTFMGTLTGISRRVKKFEGGQLEVINANERNVDLIEGLGLNYILTLDTSGESWQSERAAISKQFQEDAEDAAEEELEPEVLSKEEKTEFILEAHENLTEANSENVPRFEDVINYLRQEIGEE